ncbi:hypothetical protein [Sulfurospirillum diekertiae]|uniref:Uncharacterized protein n=1 Tax=Sulfurospirillum diekertiae TaxID=1854492 RepID=A0AA92FFT6_9BACT|nr:hypothetical protein [Sulfurospirillum diekertiae]MDD3343535.1 hypothetical protein [Sulfurospirillaceae bacterium]NCC19193.1 hypothetical protein [Bacteroidia bacterium]QIR75223.1 hypothetical protein FA584_02910 [Sulfurospirillum diekertiae]
MNLFKSFCFLSILMTPFVSAADFQDKYLSCTLVDDNGKTISEREAKGRNEFNIDVVFKQSEAIFKNETFPYSTTTNGGDRYSKCNLFRGCEKLIFNSSSNIFFFIETNTEGKATSQSLYKCTSRDKTLFDTGSEMKLKLKSLF